MLLTRLTHACIRLDAPGLSILVDPGTFTPEAATALETVDLVLVTHDHFDHLDVEQVAAAMGRRRGLRLFGPPSAVDALRAAGVDPGQVHAVTGDGRLDIAGAEVRAFCCAHGAIHEGIAVPDNIGYLIDDRVYHPGDSYVAPPFPVDTLLVPTSGPWTRVGDAIDFITAVRPRRTVPIHDVMSSEVGRRSMAMFLGPDGLTGTAHQPLEPGGGTLQL